MKIIITAACAILSVTAYTQPRYNAALLDTLQTIASTQTPARHFAQLYYQAIEITNKYAADKPDSVRHFIFGFEAAFAPVFFTSYKNYISHTPQIPAWEQYYKDTAMNELQYKFIGMNAHINGDMCRALKDTYCYDTLQKYKLHLIRFQEVLNTFFDSVYVASSEYKKLNRLHFLTIGLDRAIGKKMLLHWRKKQVQMAMLYYTNPRRFERNSKRVKRRMQRWDRFAARWIK